MPDDARYHASITLVEKLDFRSIAVGRQVRKATFEPDPRLSLYLESILIAFCLMTAFRRSLREKQNADRDKS